MKILIAEKIADKGIEKLIAEGAEVDVLPKLTREELLAAIGQYDGLIVRSVTKVNEELYSHAVKLKVVGRAGNGVDNIDIEGATQRGIIVVNTPESNVVSAAELTIGLLLASTRNIPRGNERVRSGSYSREGLKGVELNGKTLGVVGLGRIGSLVTTRMKSFGMNVIAYDPYITDARFKKFGVEKKDKLVDLMKTADFLTVHTPKTEETIGIIGREEFKAAKPGLRVVNCARGGIIDEEALQEALEKKIVSSAAIDVLVSEPHPDTPLMDFENVVFTPHSGADTVEAQNNVGLTVAQEVISALRGEMVPNAVNMPTIHTQEMDELKPYMELGETLGKMYYQLEKDAVEKIEINYSGAAAEFEMTSVLTLAILKGVFEPVLKEKVNYVNAQLVADSRGVAVTETKDSVQGNYLNLIRVKIISHDHEFTISGTVFGKREIRIVDINGYEFDVMPTKYMLFAENVDKPGMVGQIGTLLGVSRTNIATMQLSRNFKDGRAMMVISIDSDIAQDTLRFISGIEGILGVKFVQL